MAPPDEQLVGPSIMPPPTLRSLCAAQPELGARALRRAVQDARRTPLSDASSSSTTDPLTALMVEMNVPSALTLAGLGHQFAHRERGDFLKFLAQSGVLKLGHRVRICNALDAARAAGTLHTLLDVQPHGMLPLPAGKGASADVSNVLKWDENKDLKRRAQSSYGASMDVMAMITQIMVHTLAPDPPKSPTPLVRTGARDDAKLLLFLACHCMSDARLAKLVRCLSSIRAQVGATSTSDGADDGVAGGAGGGWTSRDWPLAGVLVSWSAESSRLRRGVRTALAQFRSSLPHGACAVVERHEACTQMQHLASLLPEARRLVGADGARLGDRENEVWVMFSDDDDVLHPARCAAYKQAIRISPAHAHAVSAMWVARPAVSEESVTSAADVERLVEAGRIVRTPKVGSENEGGGGSWDECARAHTPPTLM